MKSRHLILIVLTGVGLVVFAPTSNNTEPASNSQIAEKQAATPSPPVQKINTVVPQMKVVLPPGLRLDGAGMLQPAAKRKIRRVVIDPDTGTFRN